jgi:membrane-associated phospholipid phosphatase
VRTSGAAASRAVTVFGSAAAALVALYVVAVWTSGGQRWDTSAMDVLVGLTRRHQGWAGLSDEILDAISPSSVLAASCGVVALAGVRRGARAAVVAFATVATTVAASEILKTVLIRPPWLDDAGNSFPSGHVSAVAALVVAAVCSLPAHRRRFAVVAGGLAVSVTALATVSHGWHRPSDVVASGLLAVCAAAGSAVGSATLEHRSPTGQSGRVTDLRRI